MFCFFNTLKGYNKKYVKKIPLFARPCKEDNRRNRSKGWGERERERERERVPVGRNGKGERWRI